MLSPYKDATLTMQVIFVLNRYALNYDYVQNSKVYFNGSLNSTKTKHLNESQKQD